MAAEEEKLRRINEKIQRLIKKMDGLQQENEKLRTNLQALHSKQLANEEQTAELVLRNEVLKATKSKLSEEEKRSLGKKINEYIREIDRCIALMRT